MKPSNVSAVPAINKDMKLANILPKYIFAASFFTKRIHSIRSQNLNCTSYLFSSKKQNKQYTRSTEEFRSRFNNYSCTHRNFSKYKEAKQESFNVNFAEGAHQGKKCLGSKIYRSSRK